MSVCHKEFNGRSRQTMRYPVVFRYQTFTARFAALDVFTMLYFAKGMETWEFFSTFE